MLPRWKHAPVRRGAVLSGLLAAFAPLVPGPEVPGSGASGLTAQEPDSTAQAPDSARFRLEGVSVEVTRPTAVSGGASAVEIEMERLPVIPAPSLSDVLRKVPLVRIRTNSRGQQQPSLRGVEERQLAILVDGVPITLGWDNRTDLSVIPLTAAQEITLIRGLSSVLSGPNVLGGVIDVGITHGPFPDQITSPVKLQAALDHNGNYSASGEVGQLWSTDGGDVLLRVGGGFRESDGAQLPKDLEAGSSDLPSQIIQPTSDEGDFLLNSDFQAVNGFVAARYQGLGGKWLSLSSLAFDTEKGVVPELHVTDPRLWRISTERRSLTAVSGGTGWRHTPWGEGDLEASIGLDFSHQEIDEFDSFQYRDSVGGETGDTRTLSARMVGDHTLLDGVLRGSATFAETRHVAEEPDSENTFKQRLWSFGLESEQVLGPVDRGLLREPTLTVGASVDGSSTPLTGDKPAQDGIWSWGGRVAFSTLVGDGTVKLHGGVSRKVRFAALRELFSGALGRFVPNPDLGPEVLKVGELAATAEGQGFTLQSTVFQQRLEDAVVRASVGDGMLQRQNRNEIRATGLELLGSVRHRGFALRGEMTLQDVDLRDPTAPGGERQPEYQPELVAGFSLEAPLPGRIQARFEVEHVGEQFCVNPDEEGLDRIDSSVFMEAGASREVVTSGGRTLRVSAVASNLADKLIFEQCGLPQAGRTFRIQLQLR